jgi:regulator of replication initiation timing
MQLREDLLGVSQEHENTMQTNFQLIIENEDLRDRLALVAQKENTSIDYLPYLVPKQLERTI